MLCVVCFTGICDTGFICLYVVYMCGFMTGPVWAVFEYDLPPVSTIVVICEQVGVSPTFISLPVAL